MSPPGVLRSRGIEASLTGSAVEFRHSNRILDALSYPWEHYQHVMGESV